MATTMYGSPTSPGSVWAVNNYLLDSFNIDEVKNPGSQEVVVFIGLAAPVKTQLIGPPEQP